MRGNSGRREAVDRRGAAGIHLISKGSAITVFLQIPYIDRAAKFVRVDVLCEERPEIEGKIERDRKDSALKEAADCAFLINEQATRPGSENDTKGLKKLYGVPLTADNVIVTPPKPNKKGKVTGKPKVELEVNGERVHIRDAGAAAEVQRRVAAGESLEDSSYWLKSHGATTLEGRHVVETPEGVRLQFMGKEGVWHDHLVENPELAKMLTERKASANTRGGKLFAINDTKLGNYVKTLDHGRVTPKDFRTARANEIAAAEIAKLPPQSPPKDEKEAKARKIQLAKNVSRKLGNKPQQCIDSYINPVHWQHQSFQVATA